MDFVKKLLSSVPQLAREVIAAGIVSMLVGFFNNVIRDLQKDFKSRIEACVPVSG